MKRIIAFSLIFVLLFCCGCEGTEKTSKKAVQYTIAMNPSIMFADGTIDSLRNSVAKSMSADSKAKTSEKLYTNTNWQWISKDDDGSWSKRLIRTLSNWTNGEGKTDSGVPFAYKFDDLGVSSLAAFDSSKMKIKALEKTYMPKSGVIISVTEGKEEAVCYTAQEDSKIILSDRDEKGISIVSDISGFNTSFLENKEAKANIVLRIYKNNRIYWQGILNKDNTGVSFPEFSEIELKKGDRLLISVLATDDIDGITTGNCDIPAYTTMEMVKVPVISDIEKVTEEPLKEKIPFIYQHVSYFTVVAPEKASGEQLKMIEGFCADMEKTLGTSVSLQNDAESLPEDYVILVGDTVFEESKTAKNDIEKYRDANAGDFIIKTVGKKVIINAGSDVGLEFALDFFMNNYCRDKNSYIESNLNYVSSKYNAVKEIMLADTSISDYKIVVSRFASFMDLSAAEYLNQQITKISGVMLPIIKDSDKVTNYEIVIGDTSRTSNNYSTVAATKSGNEYKVSVSANRTVFSGESTAAVNASVIAFAEKLSANGSLESGFELKGSYDGGYTLTDGYKLTWSDEFDGETLSKLWIDSARKNPSVYGGTAYSSIENSFIKDGTLVQRISRDGSNVIESDLMTKDRMMYKYGYMEVRIRLSPNKGSWGALWMVGPATGTMMGEVDIFENFGSLNSLKSNLHTWGPGDEHENILGGKADTILNLSPGTTNPEPYSNNYHTLGFEWNKGYMAFYLDGIKHTEYNYDSVKYDCFDKPFHLLLSHWGGEDIAAFANCILPDDFQYSDIYYDWIRIYQTEDAANILYTKE